MTFFQRRVTNFRSALSSRELDAILLASYRVSEPNHYNYDLYYVSNLLGFFPWCFLIITEDDCGAWVDVEHVERARRQSWIDKIEPMEPEGARYSPEEFAKIAAKHLRELLGVDKIKVGVDGSHMPSNIALSLIKEGLQVEDMAFDLEKSRLIKDERELELLRKAADIADKGVEKVMDAVHDGVTERELSVLAECEMRKSGAQCFWWPSIIASGPETETWADSPTQRKIVDGDLLWMDFTPVYMGYAADIARAFVYGEASEEQLRIFHFAEKALDEAASTLRDGVTIREVMEAAAQTARGSPYERYYVGPGHGIGMYNSIYPTFLTSISKIELLPTSILDMKLLKGMTVAIEIIFAIPGLGGVRLEDDYIVTTNQPERLTNAPITATIS